MKKRKLYEKETRKNNEMMQKNKDQKIKTIKSKRKSMKTKKGKRKKGRQSH